MSVARVKIGAEIFIERHLDLVKGKRVGIVCNHTSVLPNGTHLIDTLQALGVHITALFSPEHGLRGAAAAGKEIANGTDSKTGIAVYSLYGKVTKPTGEMLRNVDVLLFDMQDIGARYFTYVSTMGRCMEGAAEYDIEFVVLDRPNPIDGISIEGPTLDTAFKSFVGMYPVPVRHGLTIGEYARMIVGEKWLGSNVKLKLQVIAMVGWDRSMWYDSTGLPWIAPSPNMKSLSTATVYPGTCLFEGTNVSEGRGTERPFEIISAPWINQDSLAGALNSLHLDGASFDPIIVTPKADSIAAPDPKFNGKECHGVYVRVTDRPKFSPLETALRMLFAVKRLYPNNLRFTPSSFDRLAGGPELRKMVEADTPEGAKFDLWSAQIQSFREKSAKYILYGNDIHDTPSHFGR